MSWLTDIFDTIGSYVGTYTPAPSQPSTPTPPTVYMPVAPRPSQPSTPAPAPTYTPPPMTVVPRGSGTAPISRTPINVSAPPPSYSAPAQNNQIPVYMPVAAAQSPVSSPPFTVVQPRQQSSSPTFVPLAPREVTPYSAPFSTPQVVQPKKSEEWWKDPSSNAAITNMGFAGSGQQGTYAPVNPRPLDPLPGWNVTAGPQVPSWFSAPDTFVGKVERDLYSLTSPIDYAKNSAMGQTIQGIPNNINSIGQAIQNPTGKNIVQAGVETLGTAMGLGMGVLGALPASALPVLNTPTVAIKESTGALQEGQDISFNDYGARWKMAQEAKAAGKSRDEVNKILFGDNRDLNSYAQETASLLGQDYAKKYRESGRVNILGLDVDLGNAAQYVPERDNPINWAVKETRDMAFSGNNALRVQAQNRILAGEDPAVAIDGATAPGPNATMDQQQLWQTRVREFTDARGRLARVDAIKAGWNPQQVSQAEQQARVEAQQLINNTGIIPGSKDVLTDMVGETAAGFVAGHTGLDPFPKVGQALMRLTGLDKLHPKGAAEKRADWLDEVYVPEMEKKVAADKTGLPERVYKGGEKAAATVADPNAGPLDKAFAKMYLDYTKLAGRTERAQASQQAQSATDFMSRLIHGADSPWTVIQRITGMVQDPHEVMKDAPELGNIPISVRAELAKPIITSDYVIKKITDLPSLNEPEFNPARFMVEFSDLAQQAAAKVNGVGERPQNLIEKIVGAQKAVMGEMYLRTPGYVLKQVLSDYATMAADGVVSFDSRAQIDDFMARMGVSKAEVSNELNAMGEPQGRESLLNKIPVAGKLLGGISDKIGDVAAQWDFDRRVRAQYAGTKKYLEENWKPILTPEVRQILGDNVADAFEANLRGALSTKELREVARRHYDPKGAGDSFSATQWMQKAGIPLDSISPQMLVQMENGARELANRGATPEETKAFFDKWRGEIDKHWRKNVASMGDVVNPRQTTENVARSDIDEVQHGATQLVKDLVEVGGMKPDEAVKRIDEVMTPLVKGEDVIRKGRESLAEKLSGIVDKPDVDVNKVASLLNWAMNKEYELRGDYRQQQAELYRKARTELDNNRRGPTAAEAWAGQVWREYFDNNRRNATKMHDDVANAYHWTAGAVDNFLAGADWNTLSKEQPDLMSIEGYAQKLIDSTRAQMDAQGADGFSKMLASDRVKGDQARQELFRRAVVTMRADPSISTDLFDVLMTSEKDVRMNAAKAATEAELVRDQMVTQGMDMKDYYTRIGEIWKNHFDFAEQRNAVAMTQLAYTQARNSEMGRMLQGLGYNDKAIAQMFARMDTADGKAAVQKEIDNLRAKALQSQQQAAVEAVQQTPARQAAQRPSGSPLDNSPSSPARDRVETYLREQFKDLPDQQMKAAMAVMDARAEIWAKQNNTTPDGWYSSRLATEGETGGDVLNQDAYHGGPHRFDKFSTDKIGSGEGNQSYGWGLYFAGKKEVAEHYRRTLERYEPNGVRPTDPIEKKAAWYVADVISQGSKDPYRDAQLSVYNNNSITTPEVAQQVQDILKVIGQWKKEGVEFKKSGQLYKVDIPDDGAYLLWDKPLNAQPEPVKKALESLGFEIKPNKYPTLKQAERLFESARVQRDAASDIGIRETLKRGYDLVKAGDEAGFRDWFDRSGGKLSPGRRSDLLGESLYSDIWSAEMRKSQNVSLNEAKRKASEILRDAGIAGVKYSDQGSRGLSGNDGTYNYVVFDDKNVNIKETYYQGPKGAVEFLDDGRAVIKALESPDISTLMHEVGHVFRRDLQGEDLGIASEWAGAKKLDNGEWQWSRDAEEKFARGFEKYLSDGEAPNVGLRRVFDQFKTWLTTIYSRLRGVLPDTMSDQMRGVYDRLLAERVDQMKPPASAEEFARMRAAPDMSPDTMRTLLSEAQRQQERVRGETDFGKMDELKAAAAQLPDAVTVNRWLQPNGEPRLSIMSNGQRYEFPNGWVDAQGGGLDKLIAEANQKYAIDGNVTGGDAQAWFDKLTEAKRVRSEMKAMLAEGKRQYEKTAKAAGDAMTGWQNIIDDLQQRLGQNKVDEAGKAAQEALSQANGDVDSAIETLTNKYQGAPEKFAAVLDALQATQQKGRPLNQGEPAPQPKQPIDNLVEAVQKLVDTLQPKPETSPAQPAPPPEPSPREKIRQIITAAAQGKLSPDQARTEINKLEPTLRDMTRTEEMALNSIGKQLQGGQPSYIQPTARINGEQVDTGHIMQRLGAEQVGPGVWQRPGLSASEPPMVRQINEIQKQIDAAANRGDNATMDRLIAQRDQLQGQRRQEAQANPFPWEREAPQPVTEQDKATLLTLSPKQDAQLKALYKRAMAKAKGQQPIVELPDVRESNLMTWFKGSEVVNGDGTPRQVYHFTKAVFDTFDPAKLGGTTRHPNTNLGFFFGDSPEISSLFASELPDKVKRQDVYREAVKLYNDKYGTKGKPNLDSNEAQSNFYEEWMNARYKAGLQYSEGGAAMPVYLSMKNPYVMPWSDWHKLNGMVYGDAAKADAIAKDFRTKLEGMGYDGIVLPKKQTSDNPEWLQDTYIVFKPEQIKSAIGNKGTFDPNNPNILYQEQPKVKADQTESPEFKKWFGESKVVDDQGMPMVLYHGSKEKFTEFNPPVSGTESETAGHPYGIYLTENKKYADSYGDSTPVYVSIKNPAGPALASQYVRQYGREAAQQKLRDLGYDGIFFRVNPKGTEGGRFNEVIAFDSSQIKSATDNRGTFDPNNPNILLQNQPEMAGTDFAKKNGLFSRPGETDPETLARYQDRAVENGAVENVAHMLDINDAVHGAGKKAIDAIEKGFADHVANWQPGEKVYSGQERGMMQKELLRLTQQHSEIFSKAREYGKQLQNSSLLDYSDKRGIDTYIQLVAPFAYWGTRQGRNYALRAMANPNLVATYWRYQQAVEAENKKKNVRGRFGASLQVPGTNLYVDPTPWLFPFSDFMGRDSMADAGEAKSAAQKAYDLAGMVGIRPGPLLDIPLRYSNLLVNKSPGEQGYGAQEAEYGRGSIGELTPINGIIQAATAAFGIGGPTGFDAEGRLRKMLGMHEAETWEPYVISRSISDMAAQANRNGGPMDTRAYLIAQRFVDDNQSNIPTALRESTAQQLSDKYHIDPQMAQQALDIARRGALTATLQKGTQQMSSFFTGLRVKQLPPGEQARWQMKQYEKGAGYNPYTDTGSRKQLQQVQDFFPALQVQRAQYGAVPGDEKSYNYLYVIEEKKRLNAQFDNDLANIIRQRPWDRDASKEIDGMRFNVLRQLDEMQGTTPPDETKPSSIYGANKTEALQIRQNDILRLVSKQAPKVENFESYDQYKSERDAYRSNVASIAAGNPQTGAILQLADKEGNGDALRKFIGGLTYNQVSTYKGRYDLPLEAAQNAYFDLVYEPAILDYNRQLVRGDPRQAWENTIGRVGATDANALASLIKQNYGGRWTDEELAQGLQGMNMPILAEMIKQKYNVAADGGFKYRQDYLYGANNIDPQTEFWRWYRNEIPPGRAANGLRDIPQVSMALDPAAAAKMTPAQWESALNLGRAWMASEFGDVPPDARVEWAQAKDESKQLNTLLMKEYGPEGQKLLDMYFNAPDAKTKAAMRKAIPMLDSILSMRQTYAEKKAIYDAYYGPGSYGKNKDAQGHYSSGGSGKGGSGSRGRARYSRGGRYRGRSSSRSYTPSFNYGYTRGYTGYVVKPMNPSSGLGPIQAPKLTPRKVKMNPLKG